MLVDPASPADSVGTNPVRLDGVAKVIGSPGNWRYESHKNPGMCSLRSNRSVQKMLKNFINCPRRHLLYATN